MDQDAVCLHGTLVHLAQVKTAPLHGCMDWCTYVKEALHAPMEKNNICIFFFIDKR